MPKVNPRVKKMAPSGVQSMLMVSGLPSLTTVGEPPSTGTFFILPSAMNAIHAPSGEKTGPAAPSVPARRPHLELVQSCERTGWMSRP